MKLFELQEYEVKDEILLEYEDYKKNPDKYPVRPGQEALDELDQLIESMED